MNIQRWNQLSTGDFILQDIAAFNNTVRGSQFSPPTNKGRITSALFMIRRGSAVFSYNSGSFKVAQGDLVYLPKGSQYTFTPDQKGLIHTLVNFDIFDRNGEYIYLSDHPVMLIKNARKGYEIILDKLIKCFLNRSFSGELRSVSLVVELIADILNDCNVQHLGYVGFERIIPAINFIEQNSNVDISTEELADMCDMSQSQLRRLFKEYSGVSPTEYRNRLRIEKAYLLLKNNFCNVTEAAESVGFNNIYYFSRLFKSVMGVGPKSVQMQRDGSTDVI